MTETTTIDTIEVVTEYPDDLDIEDDVATIEAVTRDDRPPEELTNAVHAALERTIGAFLDGREVIWSREDDDTPVEWTFTIGGMMPSAPRMPAYQTAEKFQGADGSGDGLMGNLPDGWGFDLKRGNTVYDFYCDE